MSITLKEIMNNNKYSTQNLQTGTSIYSMIDGICTGIFFIESLQMLLNILHVLKFTVIDEFGRIKNQNYQKTSESGNNKSNDGCGCGCLIVIIIIIILFIANS